MFLSPFTYAYIYRERTNYIERLVYLSPSIYLSLIYIYRERETEGERAKDMYNVSLFPHIHIYIYIYIYIQREREVFTQRDQYVSLVLYR